MKNNEGVKKAKEADWKEKYILEMNTTKTDGYNEGLEQGQKLGLEHGKKLGEINKEKEIAKKLKQDNMSLEYISKITGLSIDEIKKL